MKATVTIEGTVEEVYKALAQLIDNEPNLIESEGPMDHDAWTETEARTVFTDMSYGAKEIFRAIASGTEPYPLSALTEEFGIDGNTVGGRMSSPTRQMRIHGFEGLPKPVRWEMFPEIGIAYLLNPVWRKMINHEIAEGGSI